MAFKKRKIGIRHRKEYEGKFEVEENHSTVTLRIKWEILEDSRTWAKVNK